MQIVVDDMAGSTRPREQQAYRKALAHSARVRRLKVLLPVAALAISMSFIAVSAVRTFLPEELKVESARIENGKVVAQPVTLGLRNDDEGYAEVTDGLDKGANVIVSKLNAVKPGAQVKLPASATPATPAKAAMLAKG